MKLERLGVFTTCALIYLSISASAFRLIVEYLHKANWNTSEVLDLQLVQLFATVFSHNR